MEDMFRNDVNFPDLKPQNVLTISLISLSLDSNPVNIRRCFDIHTTFITLKRRRTDFKTTSCAYWETNKNWLKFALRKKYFDL